MTTSAEGIVENAATFTGVVLAHKFSLKLLADVLSELEKESTTKAKRFAHSQDYDMLTELAKGGIEENDPDNNPNLVPTKYLFLWGMGIKEDSPEEVKKDVEKFQDTLIMAHYLHCTYECWVKRQSRAKRVKLYGGGIIGVYDNKGDAEAEKEDDQIWEEEGNWKCWIRRKSGAKRVKLHERGVIGAFTSGCLAEEEGEDHTFWVKGLENGDKYGVFGDKTLDAYIKWLEDYNRDKPPKEEPSETSYTVKKGDTLSKIADKLGIDEWYDIYELNKDTIENPDIIRVGQVIKLPQLDRNQKGQEMSSQKTSDAKEYYGGRSYTCPFDRFSVTLCDFDGNPVEMDSETPYTITTEDGEVLIRGKMSSPDEISIDLPKNLRLFVIVNGLRYGITS